MKQKGYEVLARFAEWLITYRVTILIIIALISAFSAYYFRKIPRDPSVEAMVLENDPDLIAYNHFKEIFGNDEMLLIVSRVDNIFDAQVMKDVESLREKLSDMPYVDDVITYTNIKSIKGIEDGIIVEKLIEEIPESKAEEQKARKIALKEKDYIGNFYSADAKTFAIIVQLQTLAKKDDNTQTRTLLTSTARNLVEQKPFDKYKWYVAGVPVLKSDLAETQKTEGKKFEIMIFIMLAFMLGIIFRTFGGIVVTLTAVQASIMMLMTAHFFSGIPLTMVSSILTPLMLIYGVSSSVHIQTHYALKVNANNITARNALIAAVAVTVIPCMFNSVTTAVGFGSNMVSSIKPIREFAMFASGGIILSLVLSFLMIPTLLSFFPKPGKQTQKAHESGLRVHVLEYIVKLTENHWKAVLVLTFILLGTAIWGMSKIRVETKLLEYFKPESDIRMSYDFIDQNLSGISTMEIMVDTGKKGGMKEPEVIAKMEELVNYFEQHESDLTSVTSLVNFYKRINMALNADNPEFSKIPETRQEAAQLIMLYSMSGPESDLYNYTSRDYHYGRISTRLKTLSSKELQALVERVKEKTNEVFKPLEKHNVHVNVTGSAVLYANMNSSLVVGQLESFGLSLLLVSLMMILVAGEIGLGLVSLLPNLMPIIMTMGLMGFMGYALDSTTAMVAPIALGMAVDSTIHFMVRFRREYLSTNSYDHAAAETVRLIGRAMIGTSIPLAAGFFVLTNSIFMPVFVFGLLSGIVVLLAMVFDLVLTPIVMKLYKPSYKRSGLVDFFD